MNAHWTDAAGLAGVAMMTIAYGGGALGWVSPSGAPALLANLIGAILVLISLLLGDFNLAATIMESIWGLVALAGLVRLAAKRR